MPDERLDDTSFCRYNWTQIARHELRARIKEEAVRGASWGHSCGERAVAPAQAVSASPGRSQLQAAHKGAFI